jgi:hypothetical protein
MLPVWRAPHPYALVAVEGDDHPTAPVGVFTYGPIAPDLVALRKPTLEQVIELGRRLGFEWLTSLVMLGDRPHGLGEPPLARYLRDRYDLSPGVAPNPFTVRRGKLVRPNHEALPRMLLEGFLAAERGRLQQIGTTLHSLCQPIEHAATSGVWEIGRRQRRAAELLNALGSPLKVARTSNLERTRENYTLRTTDLYTRALLEIVQLYDERPLLARCAACGRVFVPGREGQRKCRRYSWDIVTHNLLATCTTTETTKTQARRQAAARRKQYKKLQMRVHRLSERLGPHHPETKRAQKEFLEWQKQNPANVGRPEKQLPSEIPQD